MHVSALCTLHTCPGASRLRRACPSNSPTTSSAHNPAAWTARSNAASADAASAPAASLSGYHVAMSVSPASTQVLNITTRPTQAGTRRRGSTYLSSAEHHRRGLLPPRRAMSISAAQTHTIDHTGHRPYVLKLVEHHIPARSAPRAQHGHRASSLASYVAPTFLKKP